MSEKFNGWIEPQPEKKLTQRQLREFALLPPVYVKKNGKRVRQILALYPLLRFVAQTARDNGMTKWEVAEEIRKLGITDPDELRSIESFYKEKIGYVSDIHGGDAEYLERLKGFSSQRQDVVIFEGDIVGTDKFSDLQRLYYNYLNNHSRNEVLKNQKEVGDEALLKYAGTKPPEKDFTLKKGFLKLRRFELELEGKNPEEIEAALGALSDHEIAAEIRRYATYVHYGHYASNLPLRAREELAAGMKGNAERILSVMKEMQAKGTKVFVMEGNWDARAPIDFEAGTPDALPLPKDRRLFDPKAFFEANGVPFFDTITTIETETTLQILLPFDAITGFPNTDPAVIAKVKVEAAKALLVKKSVVLVAHGEPNYRIHHLTSNGTTPAGEHTLIVNGMSAAIAAFRPDEVVYGHLHDSLTDEKGNKKDKNTKYALKVLKDGSVEPVPDSKDFSDEQSVASYMQYRHFASMFISKRDSQRKVRGFGGNREPARVS
jgi:predicted phosphodiesterase